MIIQIIEMNGVYQVQQLEDLEFHKLEEITFEEFIQYRAWLNEQLQLISNIIN